MLLRILTFVSVIKLVLSQAASPCPDILVYEERNAEDRWYGILTIGTETELKGLWLHITLDRAAELLGNWFGDTTTSDNIDFIIKNPKYKLEVGPPIAIRFFVKYNSAGIIPSVSEVRVNGKVVCPSSKKVESTTQKLHIANASTDKNRPSNSNAQSSRPTNSRPSSSSRPSNSGRPNSSSRPTSNNRPSSSSSRPQVDESTYNNNRPSGNSQNSNTNIYSINNQNNRPTSNSRPNSMTRPTTEEIFYPVEPLDPYNRPNTNRPTNNNHVNRPVENIFRPTINYQPSDNYDSSENYRPTNNYRPSQSEFDIDTDSQSNRPNGPPSSNNALSYNNNRPSSNNYDNSNNRPSGSRPSSNNGFSEEDNIYNNNRRPSTSSSSQDSDNNNDFFPGDFALLRPTSRPSTDVSRPSSYNPLSGGGTHRFQCGKKATLHSALIAYGSKTQPGEWPWHIALYYSSVTELKYICGGTLISPSYVLTAAHCVCAIRSNRPHKASSFVVVLGKYRLKDFGQGTQSKNLEEIIVHPRYNFSTLNNDIAIIKLESPADLTDNVRTCCLWEEETSLEAVTGRVGTLVGWGNDENSHLTDTLMQASMPIVSATTCIYSDRDFFPQYTSETTFCAGYLNGTSACSGDSGSGMVLPRADSPRDNPVWQIRGIVSLSAKLQGFAECNPNKYVVFTDVAKHLRWIKSKITD